MFSLLLIRRLHGGLFSHQRLFLPSADGVKDGGDHSADEQGKQRIGYSGHKLNKHGAVPQRLHSAAHGLHTVHQHGEGKQDHTDVLKALLFAEEEQNNADEANKGKNGNLPHCLLPARICIRNTLRPYSSAFFRA